MTEILRKKTITALKNKNIDLTKHKAKEIQVRDIILYSYSSITIDNIKHLKGFLKLDITHDYYDDEFVVYNIYTRLETLQELATRLIKEYDENKRQEKYKKDKINEELKTYQRLKKKFEKDN